MTASSPPARGLSFSPAGFEPAWWLPGPHVQTIAGRWLRPVGGPVYDRRRIITPDGDFLFLDVARTGTARTGRNGRTGRDGADGSRLGGASRGIVLLLHGLEGCSESRYMLETCRRLAARSLQPIALNFRSCGGEPNRTRRFYHSGETRDLAFVVRWIRRRRPDLPLGVIGYSLGGNMLLKYLGELGAAEDGRRANGGGEPEESPPIDAAVAVSVPYDLAASARKLEADMTGGIYARFFLRSLRRSIRSKAERYAHDYDLEALADARTLREFDEAITAPVHGFADAADYYRSCSSLGYLPQIRVPTLLLQAEDDPFLPAGSLPRGEVAANPWLRSGFTAHGGHLGFVEGDGPGSATFWAERQAARYMAAALKMPGAGDLTGVRVSGSRTATEEIGRGERQNTA